jgi:hypothetical protein
MELDPMHDNQMITILPSGPSLSDDAVAAANLNLELYLWLFGVDSEHLCFRKGLD